MTEKTESETDNDSPGFRGNVANARNTEAFFQGQIRDFIISINIQPPPHTCTYVGFTPTIKLCCLCIAGKTRVYIYM